MTNEDNLTDGNKQVVTTDPDERRQEDEVRFNRRTYMKGALAAGGLAGVGTLPTVGAQNTGGPVVLMGIDAEDGGPGAHGPISVYESVVNSILSEVTNGGNGIVVIGANGPGPVGFWNAIQSGTGVNVTYVNGATQIGTVDFNNYAMLGVVSSEPETWGGLTNAENEALIARNTDIAAFVNNGGGLLGFSQTGTATPWGYIGSLGAFQTSTGLSYVDIEPTSDGQAIGVTDALDVCCWHDTFTEWPDFLEVLAWEAGSGQTEAAALGGASVTITPVEEKCVDLIAGRNIDVGEVCVINDDENLTVTYSTTDTWRLTETHLHVADSADDVPQTQGGPVPGRFDNQVVHDPTLTNYTYEIPLANLNAEQGDELVIAAHADVIRSLGDDIQSETAWGNGERFVERGDWAMYFTYEVQ